MQQLARMIPAVAVLFCAAAAADDPAGQLKALFDDYDQWSAQTIPDRSQRPGAVYSVLDEDIEREHKHLLEFRDRLDAIDIDRAGEDDRISALILKHRLEEEIGNIEHDRYHFLIGHRTSIYLLVATLGEGVVFENAEEIEAYLDRLENDLPRQIAATQMHLRRGMEAERTMPRIIVEHVPEQIDSVIETALHDLGDPIAWAQPEIPEEEFDRLWRRLHHRTLPTVAAALTELREFMTEEYIPAARETIGLSEIPGGSAFYRHRLHVETGTTESPESLHERGRKSVEEIRLKLAGAIRHTPTGAEIDEDGSLDDVERIAAFRREIEESGQFRFDSSEAMLKSWRNRAKEIDGWLPMFFRTLPMTPLGITEVGSTIPGTQPGIAHYHSGDLKTGYAAWVTTHPDLIEQVYTFELPALILHEGLPGHHLQCALAVENRQRPEFRRMWWNAGFGEGWAMYAEQLGREMRQYDDPYEEVGRLHWLAVRACRLKLDPGINEMGMTREQAVSILRDNTLLDDQRIASEIERYLVSPGQATSYWVGLETMMALRERAEDELGGAFDVRAFHDVVLEAGAVPLPVAEERVTAWIERRSAAASARSDGDGSSPSR